MTEAQKAAEEYAKALKGSYTDGARSLIAEDFLAGWNAAIKRAENECHSVSNEQAGTLGDLFNEEWLSEKCAVRIRALKHS